MHIFSGWVDNPKFTWGMWSHIGYSKEHIKRKTKSEKAKVEKIQHCKAGCQKIIQLYKALDLA
jgi:hypothetical protein